MKTRSLFFSLICLIGLIGLGQTATLLFAQSVPTALHSIPDPTADRVLGQSGFTTADPGTTATTLYNPSGVALTTDGRLFVVDYSNNRVLSWPSAADFTNGQAADLALGPPDLNSATGGATQRRLTAPESVAADGSGNVWVADSFNARLLLFKPPFSTGMNASVVIGQADFVSSAPNRNAADPNHSAKRNTLWSPRGMSFDSQGRLYVADQFNNRVLRYVPPFSNGMNADLVIGQADFTSQQANRDGQDPKSNSFWSPVAVALDSADNLYVADRDNNRVMRFNNDPLSNGMNASDLIGQTSFVSAPTVYETCTDIPWNNFVTNPAADTLSEPLDLAFNAVDTLFVSDLCFNRVLGYDDPLNNDAIADYVYGQADFSSSKPNRGAAQPAANSLNNPLGMAVSGIDGTIYLADDRNHRLLAFDVPVEPTPISSPTPSATLMPTSTPNPTATSIITATATSISSPTNTASPTNTTQPAAGDSFEEDDACNRAQPISVNGTIQSHTFHDAGDADWLRFPALANKSYIIEVQNVGSKADAVVGIFDVCGGATSSFQNNAFGNTVRVDWNSTKKGDYVLQLQQYDPSIFGAETSYQISIKEDSTPPSPPKSPRCVTISSTSIGIQWQRSAESDVTRYRVNYRNESSTNSGSPDVEGGATTYFELGNLTPNELYLLRVYAVDYSGNESQPTGEISCRAATVQDNTQPTINLQQPSASNILTTTNDVITFSGLAQDSGANLSRVLVKNQSSNSEKGDFSLSGASHEFRIENLPLTPGSNSFQLTVFDATGNSSQRQITVNRVSGVAGAAVIVAGQNDTLSLQANIYHTANRAYRILKSAGYTADTIYYIAPLAQDADGDGASDVDATSSPTAVQQAITQWAAQNNRLGAGKPFFVYLVDHGFAEKFCVNGCGPSGQMTPKDLDGWLRTLESATGVTDVNIVIEACQSGSFIDRFNGDVENSLAKAGRLVVTSTGRTNNAYASAQGAYFSDAFFSCAADSNSFKACYDQAVNAVNATGVNQTPWLDDNGDGLASSADGSVAQNRQLTRFFSSIRPQIVTAALDRNGANGTLRAQVEAGAEQVTLVWAAIYPPSFQEPGDVTLNLNVPVVRLEPVVGQAGQYASPYSNGFSEAGEYRVVFYAQDQAGIHAIPRQPGGGASVYLPLARR